jgi:hypothetical protein
MSIRKDRHMGMYHTSNEMAGTPQSITTSGTKKTITQLSAATATLRRARVQDILLGASNVPNATDCAIQYQAARQTTLGTGTTATPSPLDLANAASDTVGTVNMTAEPTTGVNLLDIVLNQRASQRWVAAPGSELYIPATNLSGIGVRAWSTNYASFVTVAMLHEDI